MKKILICLLACMMLLAMVGCSSDKDGGSKTTPPELQSGAADFLGEVTGTKYENEFIGIGINLESGWRFKTEEEIMQLNNYVEGVADQSYMDILKNATVVYDMMAVSADETSNMVVTLEKKPNALLENLDLNQVLSNSFNLVKATFQNMGYRNISHQITTVTIDGKEMPALHISATINGLQMRQTNILIKCDGYLASISFTALNVTSTANLLDNLYFLK